MSNPKEETQVKGVDEISDSIEMKTKGKEKNKKESMQSNDLESTEEQGASGPPKRGRKTNYNVIPCLSDLVNDPDKEGSIIPPLNNSNIQSVIEINDGLIELMQEFQNRDWIQEPDFIAYQRRLHSNLIYLSSVADHYLNPQKVQNFVPLGKKEESSDANNPPKGKISSATLTQLLEKSANAYKNKFELTDPRLILFDKLASTKAAQFTAQGQTKTENVDAENLPEPSPYDLHVTYKVFDPPISGNSNMKYKPLPPFRVPDEVELPPFN